MHRTPAQSDRSDRSIDRRSDGGFTLVEILIAIVLVGVLSAVVVVGVSNLTSKGAGAACTASLDAARTASSTYLVTNGTPAATFTDLTAGSSPALVLPSGVSVTSSGRVATNGTWSLVMTPGSGMAPATFVCSTDLPTGFAVGPNGHFYRYVATSSNWAAARTAATQTVVAGANGYLATITSAEEQNFVYGLVPTTSDAWLGGREPTTEGVWIWADGPEAGTQFSQGAASVNGSYVAWAVSNSQPDGTNMLSCLTIYQRWGNAWDDVMCSPLRGYVVEVGG